MPKEYTMQKCTTEIYIREEIFYSVISPIGEKKRQVENVRQARNEGKLVLLSLKTNGSRRDVEVENVVKGWFPEDPMIIWVGQKRCCSDVPFKHGAWVTYTKDGVVVSSAPAVPAICASDDGWSWGQSRWSRWSN